MNDTKRQNLPPGLWVVATPIGNLSDLTERARHALQEADLILCEDTRRTHVLLSALHLSRRPDHLERMDAHTEIRKIQSWVEKLQSGIKMALVTDAGTPGISDPGALLVAEAQKVGVRVIPIPGPSSVPSLLSVSGFQDTAFTFRGYFPRRLEDQRQEFQQASSSSLSRVYVWFESPLRIRSTLEAMSQDNPTLSVVVAKELTKIYERLFHGSFADVTQQVIEHLNAEGEMGEWCFAVQFAERKASEMTLESKIDEALDWVKALQCLLGAGVSQSVASKQISQYFGIPKKISYKAALEVFGKKNKEWG